MAKVKAACYFTDLELNKEVSRDEIYEVSEERADLLSKKRLVTIVERALKPKKEASEPKKDVSLSKKEASEPIKE